MAFVVFNNFLLIDATDRSNISSNQKRFFIALSLYPLSFFANTLLNSGTIWHFFDKNVKYLSARDFKVSTIKIKKNIKFSFLIISNLFSASHFCKYKFYQSQAKIYFSKYVKMGKKRL